MKLRDLALTIREYGAVWAFWRGLYAAALRSGWCERRLPGGGDSLRMLREALDRSGGLSGAGGVADLAAAAPGLPFVPAGDDLAACPEAWRRETVRRADRVLEGWYPHFWGERRDGVPPDWFRADAAQPAWPRDAHWSRITDLGPAGDIKQVWERSRFTFAFTLGRAWLVSRDDRYAERFWQLVESWLDADVPEMGPHWRCAQEVSLRSLAWLFGWHALRDAPASTPERVERLVASLWRHGRHIAAMHWYAARCVRNNHAISEAVALHALGAALPFLPEAARWRTAGASWLRAETAWQIRPNGNYVQPSNNYMRAVTQLLTWHLALMRRTDGTAGAQVEVAARLDRLQRRLGAQLCPHTGRAPNWGPNDGTLLFPWSSCEPADFRPAVHAAGLAAGGAPDGGSHPWSEEAFWFGLVRPASLTPPGEAQPAQAADGTGAAHWQVDDHGGMNLGRCGRAFVKFQCGPNLERPAEADMMHVDYRLGSCVLLLDPGTYGYNVEAKWRGYFAGTGAHNSVTLDGRDQMRRGARFLWHDWVHGERLPGQVGVAGRHLAWAPAEHLRRVALCGEVLVVHDVVTGAAPDADVRLHWLVADLERTALEDGAAFALPDGERASLRVWCDVGGRRDWVRDDRDEPRGVHAPAYGELAAAWSYRVAATGSRASFVTLVGPAGDVDALAAGAAGETDILQRCGWPVDGPPTPERTS